MYKRMGGHQRPVNPYTEISWKHLDTITDFIVVKNYLNGELDKALFEYQRMPIGSMNDEGMVDACEANRSFMRGRIGCLIDLLEMIDKLEINREHK